MSERLSERLPHKDGCNFVFHPGIDPNECDCYVGEVAVFEARLEAMEQENRVFRANLSKSVLRRLSTQISSKHPDAEKEKVGL